MSIAFPNYNHSLEAMKKIDPNITEDSICGFCKIHGATVLWPTSTFSALHNECYPSIKPIADRLVEIVTPCL